MDLTKLQIKANKYSKHFKKIATDVVTADVGETDDENKKSNRYVHS